MSSAEIVWKQLGPRSYVGPDLDPAYGVSGRNRRQKTQTNMQPFLAFKELTLDLALTVNSEIFARTLFSRNFAYAKFREIKPSRNDKIILSFIDIGKSCLNGEFLTALMCLLMLFAKTKFSRKFPNLHVQYYLQCCFGSKYSLLYQNQLSKNNSGIPPEYQTAWNQIKSEVSSGLILVRTVCKANQLTYASR